MVISMTILLFRVANEKELKIQEICREQDISVRKIPQKDYGQKMGYLAGIQGFKKENQVYKGGELPVEMLVFSGMDSDQLDEFLKAYRERGIAPIGCKAVLTANNLFWTAEKLFQELLKEQLQFTK